MNTGLEYNLALRVRSATRWVEGQQGMLPDDGDGAVDGFGRAMLVRTGALPTPYTGAEGVAGTTIDRQPDGANVAGVAVLIKDLNNGKLAANTTYSARLGGFLTGKALYFVEVTAAAPLMLMTGFTYGTLSVLGGNYNVIVPTLDTYGLNRKYLYQMGNTNFGPPPSWFISSGYPCIFTTTNYKVGDYDFVSLLNVFDFLFPCYGIKTSGSVQVSGGPTGSGKNYYANDHLGISSKMGDGYFKCLVSFNFRSDTGTLIATQPPTTTSTTLGAPLGSPLGG